MIHTHCVLCVRQHDALLRLPAWQTGDSVRSRRATLPQARPDPSHRRARQTRHSLVHIVGPSACLSSFGVVRGRGRQVTDRGRFARRVGAGMHAPPLVPEPEMAQDALDDILLVDEMRIL